jgi:putative integral membrane protein (TIGR02587 family)
LPGEQQLNESPRFRFWVGLGRAYGSAIIFSLPLLMTMEMWQLGFYMSRLRLCLFILLFIPVLVRLSYHAGFEETAGWREDLRDAFVAYGVGFTASAAVLALLAVIQAGMPLHEIVGKISMQAVPASIGAILARTQLGRHGPRQRRSGEGPRYGGELFLMLVGALFFARNPADFQLELHALGYQEP